MTRNQDGRVAEATGLSQAEPQEGLVPPGFDPSRELARLTPYMREAILAKDPEQISTGSGGVSFYLTRRGLAVYVKVSAFKNRLALTSAGFAVREAILAQPPHPDDPSRKGNRHVD